MTRHPKVVLALVPLMAACETGRASVEASGNPVTLLDYTTTAPADWVTQAPSSSLRLAQYEVPAQASDSLGGEVVVYYFGAGQGGSVEANTARWRAQFFEDSGGHPEPTVTRLEDASFPTTVVELRGRYARAIGMGGTQAEAAPDQVLLAAVVETPQGSLFIQLHGPSATVLGQKDAFYGFVRGLRATA